MQLAIYPEQAEYARRDFRWRLSSAQVEAEESEFTPLPGFWRFLMIIEGVLALEHEGHHSVTLKPYDQDSFSGAWKTRSKGRVTDFNLMLGEGCMGTIEAIRVVNQVQSIISGRNSTEVDSKYTEAYYCCEGSVQITVNEESHDLLPGDLLRIDFQDEWEPHVLKLENKHGNAAVIIKSGIQY